MQLLFRIVATIIVAACIVLLALAFLAFWFVSVEDIKTKKTKREYVSEFTVCLLALIPLGFVIYVLWTL